MKLTHNDKVSSITAAFILACAAYVLMVKFKHVNRVTNKHYKYEIHTQKASYFTDSLDTVNGVPGFYNSNRSYIQIK